MSNPPSVCHVAVTSDQCAYGAVLAELRKFLSLAIALAQAIGSTLRAWICAPTAWRCISSDRMGASG